MCLVTFVFVACTAVWRKVPYIGASEFFKWFHSVIDDSLIVIAFLCASRLSASAISSTAVPMFCIP